MKSINLGDFKIKNNCVSFGSFDGVHKGHRQIIDLLTRKFSGLNSVILNVQIDQLTKDRAERIYTEEEKKFILEDAGLMYYVNSLGEFDIYNMEAEEFIREIIVRVLDAKKVVVGEGCRFGKDKKGNLELLLSLAPILGFEVIVCNTIKYQDNEITSERIKGEIRSGNIIDANEMLGEAYFTIGEVIHGKALGRTVGMPTANLATDDIKVEPQHGVYATISRFDGDVYKGLTNIGRRPSVDDYSYTTMETYLLDFSGDIYGKRMKIEMHNYIRGVVKFNNLNEVKSQVEKDIQEIENCFKGKLVGTI